MQPAFYKPVVIEELICPGKTLKILFKSASCPELARLGELDHTACDWIKAGVMLGSVAVLEVEDSSDEMLGVELWKNFKAASSGGSRDGCGPWARTPARACSSGTVAEAAKRSARVPILIFGGVLMAASLP